MASMTISLPDELIAFIETQVAPEGYASADEYLRALLLKARKEKTRKELEAKLLKGLEGESTEMTREEWNSIENEAMEGLIGEKIRP